MPSRYRSVRQFRRDVARYPRLSGQDAPVSRNRFVSCIRSITTIPATLLPLLFLTAFLVPNSPTFPVRGGEFRNPVLARSLSLPHSNYSDLSCLSGCSSEDSTVFSMSSYTVQDSTFCDPQVTYRNQPAECQTAANTQRIALYLPVALALLLGLSAVTLAFLLIRL